MHDNRDAEAGGALFTWLPRDSSGLNKEDRALAGGGRGETLSSPAPGEGPMVVESFQGRRTCHLVLRERQPGDLLAPGT